MTVFNDRFWAKVVFKEFIRHYRKLTPEQKVADIDASMDALEDLDDSGDSFGSKMVRWSMERVDQYPMARENGKKGGRPRKDVALDTPVHDKASNRSTEGTQIASVPSVQKAPSVSVAKSEPAVMNLAYSGEFGNVQLTQEEYSELGIRFGNKRALDRAIDSLSARIENGEKNPKSCYAELIKWVNYREDMDEKKELEESKPKMSNMEKSWIAAMKKVEMM